MAGIEPFIRKTKVEPKKVFVLKTVQLIFKNFLRRRWRSGMAESGVAKNYFWRKNPKPESEIRSLGPFKFLAVNLKFWSNWFPEWTRLTLNFAGSTKAWRFSSIRRPTDGTRIASASSTSSAPTLTDRFKLRPEKGLKFRQCDHMLDQNLAQFYRKIAHKIATTLTTFFKIV